MSLSQHITLLAKKSLRTYWWLYVIGILILLVSGWLWWAKVYLSPQRVFWDMLATSLSTRSVTVELSQASGNGTIKQVVQYELGATNKAHSITNLTQGTTKVQTEIIGTVDTDYTRYRSIETDQLGSNGKPLDLSKVVNVWAKSDPASPNNNQRLLAQAALGVGLPMGSVPVPIGELSAKDRAELLEYIKQERVYDISFAQTKSETRQGRLVYVYDVKIPPILYVHMMKKFAASLGLHELEDVNPDAFQGNHSPLQMRLVVDARSRQLVGVEHPTMAFKQTYSGYGLPVEVTLPTQTIPASELQQRLISL